MKFYGEEESITYSVHPNTKCHAFNPHFNGEHFEAEGDYFNLGHVEESGKTNLTLVCQAWALGLLFTSLWLRLHLLPCSPQVHR